MTDVRVKICGITNLEDAQVALDAGADLLGFIFYPKSPRYVEPAQVKEIVAGLRRVSDQSPIPSPRFPKFVGVFVNEDGDNVAAILDHTGINYAQLHGGEPPTILERLAPRAFKALRPTSREEALIDAESYGKFGPADGPQLMIDAYDPAAYGGTGKKADWLTAAGLAHLYPRLLLAGGLTPVNVAQAVRTVRPWGVDVGSGVEIEPGRKDHPAVRSFIARAKGALA
ncbi:MAG: phosphoribosylanthranilate isomerase [Caldilineaceae bacterium]|nr:phosphoribosylanthranilate isomerase [Caldilineaceae bacterium]